MTDEQRVDPRYDPAFQRGFQGSVTSSPRVRSAPQREAIVTPAPFRVADATEGETEKYAAADAPALAERYPETAAGGDADSDIEATAAIATRRLSRNPYFVTVTILGVVLVAGGAIWANQARTLVSGRGGAATDLDYWFLETTVFGAPLTIVTGLAILAGALFFAASTWQRRR